MSTEFPPSDKFLPSGLHNISTSHKECLNWFLMQFKPIITMHSKILSFQTLPSCLFVEKLSLLLRLHISIARELKLIV